MPNLALPSQNYSQFFAPAVPFIVAHPPFLLTGPTAGDLNKVSVGLPLELQVRFFILLPLLMIMGPLPVKAQSKVWVGHMSGDLGIGTFRGGSGTSSFDVTATLSLTAYQVRPVFSAALIGQAFGCLDVIGGSCPPGESTWVGGGATCIISRTSFAQPFVTAEIGSFDWRLSERGFAWQGTAGLALVKNDFSFRLLGRFRRSPDLGITQFHWALGVGSRL